MSEAYHKIHIAGSDSHHQLRRRNIYRSRIIAVVIVIARLRVVRLVITPRLAIDIAITAMMVVFMMVMSVVMAMAAMTSACFSQGRCYQYERQKYCKKQIDQSDCPDVHDVSPFCCLSLMIPHGINLRKPE